MAAACRASVCSIDPACLSIVSRIEPVCLAIEASSAWARLRKRGVELLGPLGYAHFEVLRSAAQDVFQRLDSLGQRGVDALRVVVQNGLKNRCALAKCRRATCVFSVSAVSRADRLRVAPSIMRAKAGLLGAKFFEKHRNFPANALAHPYNGGNEAVAFCRDCRRRPVRRFLDRAGDFKARHAQRFGRLCAMLDKLLSDARAALGEFLVDGRSRQPSQPR